jgi:ADP-heptose:LPS heptosyltransferase
VKILVLRFSSIGDIVLTTPVLRAIKDQLPDSEIHYLTKIAFQPILQENPCINKVWTFKDSVDEIVEELSKEQFDHIVDLHHNIRTLKLKRALKRPSSSFPKLNIKKWLYTNFKIDQLPSIHIVDRYFEAVRVLNVKNKNYNCEYFLSDSDKVDIESIYGVQPKQFIGIAIGAQFGTKRLPTEKIIQLLEVIDEPVLLLGGKEDQKTGDEIISSISNKQIHNACGRHSISASAYLVSQSKQLITHDTGLMHIATCFNIPVISIWGNTTPKLGMYPYYPKNDVQVAIHEVNGLRCRPCSKIGYMSQRTL